MRPVVSVGSRGSSKGQFSKELYSTVKLVTFMLQISLITEYRSLIKMESIYSSLETWMVLVK